MSEYAYDREPPFGKLARGLDEGPQRGWVIGVGVIVSMRDDWRQVWP